MNAPDTARPLDPGLEADILSAVEANEGELTALLATLVRFPSLLGQEASAQDFMEGLFQGMGLRTARFAVSDSELSHLPGYSPGPASDTGTGTTTWWAATSRARSGAAR